MSKKLEMKKIEKSIKKNSTDYNYSRITVSDEVRERLMRYTKRYGLKTYAVADTAIITYLDFLERVYENDNSTTYYK